jgi:hypothetical protein
MDRAEPLFQKPPVDPPTELGQRVVGIDDLIEPGAKHIRLPAVSTLLLPHRLLQILPSTRTESRLAAQLNFEENPSAADQKVAKSNT